MAQTIVEEELSQNHRNCSGTLQDCPKQIALSYFGCCQFSLWWRKHKGLSLGSLAFPALSVCSLDLWIHLSQLFLRSGRKNLRWENHCSHWGHCSKPTLCFGLTFRVTKSQIWQDCSLLPPACWDPLREIYLECASSWNTVMFLILFPFQDKLFYPMACTVLHLYQ